MRRQKKSIEAREPRIFLSYAREDSALVTVIADFLAPLPIPVFLDTRSVRPGQEWRERVVDELEKATHVYVFWSKDAATSEWVAKEIKLALKGQKVVIPVIIDDTPLPHDVSRYMGIDVRFVAGVNRGRFDVGSSISQVGVGGSILEELGIHVNELLSEPWQDEGRVRADGYLDTDPRLVAIGMYGALVRRILRSE